MAGIALLDPVMALEGAGLSILDFVLGVIDSGAGGTGRRLAHACRLRRTYPTRLGPSLSDRRGWPRWHDGAPCCGWPAEGELEQNYPVAALKAAWKPGRERSTMASLAVSEIRNHPGNSKAAPGSTYTSCSASRAVNASSSAIGDRTTT